MIDLNNKTAIQRIEYLYDAYGQTLVASTSFGIQSAVMLDLIQKHAPDIPVIFIDTGYLFPETYQYIEELKNKVNLQTYSPVYSPARQEALYGKLWEQGETGLSKYGEINKVEPMNRALKEIGAVVWMSGLRRTQSDSRVNRNLVEQRGEVTKVYPILDWPDAQVSAYFHDNNLPHHPLESQGYVTMGDTHSTIPLDQATDKKSTRFGGCKYECGLHDYQI